MQHTSAVDRDKEGLIKKGMDFCVLSLHPLQRHGALSSTPSLVGKLWEGADDDDFGGSTTTATRL